MKCFIVAGRLYETFNRAYQQPWRIAANATTKVEEMRILIARYAALRPKRRDDLLAGFTDTSLKDNSARGAGQRGFDKMPVLLGSLRPSLLAAATESCNERIGAGHLSLKWLL